MGAVDSGVRARSVWTARWVFWFCGGFGLLVLAPQVTMLDDIARDYPPAVTHLEFFYGFLGVGIAWQIAFLVMGWDPLRFRPLMPVAVLEKISFGVPGIALVAMGKAPALVALFAALDLLMGAAFLYCHRATRQSW